MSQQQIVSQIFRLGSSKFYSQQIEINGKRKSLGFQKKMTSDLDEPQLKKINTYTYFCNSVFQVERKNRYQNSDQLAEGTRANIKKKANLVDLNYLKYPQQRFLIISEFEPNVLRIGSPVIIVGDIHGQFYDLLNIFELNGYPTDKKFLFLGDYVDRGLFCIEKNVFLLRGNHEGRVMTSTFNFRIQCEKKYGIQIYERFMDLFCKLPLCAVIDQMYFAVHGGISPEISTIKQIEKINRFSEIHNRGLICDLVWSDPTDSNLIQWQPNVMRGCSYYYSKIQAKRFLKENKVKMIIRGHEVQIQGYNYQKSNTDQKLTLTIFSAPNYCDTYKNKGAIALIADNKISIHRFSEVQHPFILSNYMDGFEFTIPGVCQLVGKILVYMLKNKRKSRKITSLVDDQILEEINAIQRIEFINKIFQQKLIENEDVLLETQIKKEEISQHLKKSYEMAYEVFTHKKQSDDQQKYPDQNVIQTIRTRKKTSLLSLKNSKLSLYENPILFKEQETKEVFGPKLQMINNINKRFFFQDETQIEERFQDQMAE